MRAPTEGLPPLAHSARLITVNQTEERTLEKHSLDFSAFPLKKMTWWERFKFLFTGKPKDIPPPPFDISKVFPGQVTKPMVKSDVKTYTTFGGCDVKAIMVRGVGPIPSREDIVQAWIDQLARGSETKPHCTVIGEAQMVSLAVTGVDSLPFDGEEHEVVRPITRGEMICVLFGRSSMEALDRRDQHLLLYATDECGDRMTCVVPNFKITGYSWAISIDDLVSEEHFTFEGDEPLYWEWKEDPNASK